MLNNLISNICRLEIRILPLGTMPNAPYIDLLTLLFCISILILTLAIATNRRKFHLIFQSLFSQRVRAQFSREIKLFEDWIYPILLVYIFSVQATFVFLLLQYFIPNVSHSFLPIALYGISFGVVILDYFLKELNVVILSYLFDYKEEKNYFYQNKFFYLTINSIVLLPILIVASYTGLKAILLLYLLVFLATYFLMIYKTISLNSKKLNLFQFFLYFCTLEILPYLILLKALLSIDNLLV